MRILTGAAALKRVDQLSKRGSEFGVLEPQVREIVEDVRRNGDKALRQYAAKWDGLAGRELKVPNAELEAAWAIASPRLRSSLRQASANIRRFCKWQRPQAWRRKAGGMAHDLSERHTARLAPPRLRSDVMYPEAAIL